jgi:hypothetical protein
MAIEFFLNFCYTALHGTRLVTDNRGLRYRSRHTELKVFCVTLTVRIKDATTTNARTVSISTTIELQFASTKAIRFQKLVSDTISKFKDWSWVWNNYRCPSSLYLCCFCLWKNRRHNVNTDSFHRECHNPQYTYSKRTYRYTNASSYTDTETNANSYNEANPCSNSRYNSDTATRKTNANKASMSGYKQ